MNLAAEAELRIVLGLDDSGFRLAQRGQNFLNIVADARHDAQTGDDDTPHLLLLLRLVPA